MYGGAYPPQARGRDMGHGRTLPSLLIGWTGRVDKIDPTQRQHHLRHAETTGRMRHPLEKKMGLMGKGRDSAKKWVGLY